MKEFHSVGAKVMSYSNPQAGLEEPLTYRRNYGLDLWAAGFDGACNYAYQHAFGHAWNDFDSGHWRDNIMAYPTVNGVVPTVQWEGYREGYDDLRYVATLENLIEKNLGLDGPAGEAARMAKAWLLHLDPTDPHTTLDAVRTSLIDQIVAHDRIKDHQYFAARLVERGYEPCPITRVGYLDADTTPQSGVAVFEPKPMHLDYNHKSMVLDMGQVRRIDVIQLYTNLLPGSGRNLNGTVVELLCSNDNASYRKIPYTYRDADLHLLELADIGVEARYFKVRSAFATMHPQFHVGDKQGGVNVFVKTK